MPTILKFSILFVLFLSACGARQDASGSPAASAIDEPTKLWVTSARLDRRTCPSESCGVVGQLFFREGVVPLESRNGWVRVSAAYAPMCDGGVNEYVDEGNNSCSDNNGMDEGKFAEWVLEVGLSEERPLDPAETATPDESLVALSDDFAQYRDSFASLANQLIAARRCTEANFREQGGFMKSVNQYRNEPVYFTYCGGMHSSNKIYVNAETAEVLQ